MHRRSPASSGGVSGVPGRGPGRRLALIAAVAVLFSTGIAGCVPQPIAGSLAATLSLKSFGSETVAVQDGIPVPTFDPQPRDTLDLSGTWRVERAQFDSDVTLTDRRQSLAEIESAARGRQLPGYDDSRWASIAVPGAVNPPPDHAGGSAWYRLHFDIPAGWRQRVMTLKFGAANYVADVWLNGRYLGYHEGGFTPFAFDATSFAAPGAANVLAVRVDTPEWGSRDDIVPWGLADWWNYGGITQRVWLEATSAVLVSRADVVPHLDGADVAVTVEHRASAGAANPRHVDVSVEILPAVIEPQKIEDLDPRSLVPEQDQPLGRKDFQDVSIDPGGVAVLRASFEIGGGRVWTIGEPELYVLRVTVADPAAQPAALNGPHDLPVDTAIDQLYTTFGIRHIAVDPEAPRVLLNGAPVAFSGVSVHDETISDGPPRVAPYAAPLTTVGQAYAQLERAQQVHATLVRTAHQPGVPDTLMLADRLGIAVWEEIPLYHFTPRTFELTLGRGIPQQMLREMALRDMNRPSVLFYGLSNESTGNAERTDAMRTLQGVAKGIDGTRLTGQASYGFDPSDGTSDPLDVAGFTFYYGVFYGSEAGRGTQEALAAAHARYPSKPLMVLEFGRWADPPDGALAQREILESTLHELSARSDLRDGGYVAAAVWWSLDDYFTMRPGISLERFGLFDTAGSARFAAAAATEQFEAAQVPPTTPEAVAALNDRALPIARSLESSGSSVRLAGYLLYGVLVTVGGLAGLLALSLTFSRVREWRKPG